MTLVFKQPTYSFTVSEPEGYDISYPLLAELEQLGDENQLDITKAYIIGIYSIFSSGKCIYSYSKKYKKWVQQGSSTRPNIALSIDRFDCKVEAAPKETEVNMDWNDANLYCKVLNVNDHGDWRLPTLGELLALADSKIIDLEHGKGYWANSKKVINEYRTYAEYAIYRRQSMGYLTKKLTVRAVRTTEVQV